jgi:hypothetical protein
MTYYSYDMLFIFISLSYAGITLDHYAREIVYLTSRMEQADAEAISQVLKKCGFPAGQLLYRKDRQQYKDIAEEIARACRFLDIPIVTCVVCRRREMALSNA